MAIAKSHGDAKIHVFGFITAKDMGEIHTWSNENLAGKLLKSILHQHKKKLLNMFPATGRNVNMWYFLWDNSRIHHANLCTQWLHNNGVTVIDLSPYSPDCNIIEHVWWDVKRRVEERECKNEKELTAAWEDEWTKTDPDFVLWLVHSMPLRIEAIIKAGGGHIPFILPHNPKSKHKF